VIGKIKPTLADRLKTMPLENASRSRCRHLPPLPSNRPITASEPVGELSGIGIRRVFPDEMAAFEELMTRAAPRSTAER
jgi:hypothetical protein